MSEARNTDLPTEAIAVGQFRGIYYDYYGETHRLLTVENPKT